MICRVLEYASELGGATDYHGKESVKKMKNKTFIIEG